MIKTQPKGWKPEYDGEHSLKLAPIKKILNKDGMKVQGVASEELRLILENIADEIQGKAQALAQQKGQKTITKNDVAFAWAMMRSEYITKINSQDGASDAVPEKD